MIDEILLSARGVASGSETEGLEKSARHCEPSLRAIAKQSRLELNHFDFYLDRHGFASRRLSFCCLLAELSSGERLKGFLANPSVLRTSPPIRGELIYSSNTEARHISKPWYNNSYLQKNLLKIRFFTILMLFEIFCPLLRLYSV